MIQINELRKSYDKVQALKGISLELAEGKITAVLGPNGSGKTTLMKSILGLIKADSGEIKVNDIQVKDNSDYRRFIGYMPQTAAFPDNLKVRELIRMLKDINHEHIHYDEELIDKLNINKIFDKTISSLSSGTKQRVSSAIAFLFDRDIIILDEPTAGLDPLSSEILKEKISNERKKGKLIIITSHILSDIEELSDRIIFLLEGVIHIDSNVHNLLEQTGEKTLSKAFAKIQTSIN
jgi:Cu-processing system ATP-binding protein